MRLAATPSSTFLRLAPLLAAAALVHAAGWQPTQPTGPRTGNGPARGLAAPPPPPVIPPAPPLPGGGPVAPVSTDPNFIVVPPTMNMSPVLTKAFAYIEQNAPCNVELYRGSALTTKPMALALVAGVPAALPAVFPVAVANLATDEEKAMAVGRAVKVVLTHTPSQLIPLDKWAEITDMLRVKQQEKRAADVTARVTASDIPPGWVQAFVNALPQDQTPKSVALSKVLVHLMAVFRARPPKANPTGPFDFPQAQKNLIFAFPSMLYHPPMTTPAEIAATAAEGPLVLEFFKVLVVNFDKLFPTLVGPVTAAVNQIRNQPNGMCPPPV